MQNKAIVLLSGGQDSTTTLLDAMVRLRAGKISDIQCVAFDYGQKHKKELKYAASNAEWFKVPFEIIKIPNILTDSALVDHKADINAPHKMNADLPASFVPGRNMLFMTIAAARYGAKGFTNIFTGVCQTDYSGYPDCRRVFIDSMEVSLGLAMGIDFSIVTPLMYKTKAQTWGMADIAGRALGFDGVDFIRKNTLTDYNGCESLNEWGRGKLDNAASKIRAQGYNEALEKGLIR